MTVRLIRGDCVEVMRGLEAESVDAIVTDPPYDLTDVGRKYQMTHDGGINRPDGPARTKRPRVRGGFMNKSWDGTGVAFDPETWGEALRVLRPGGHLLAFGGTRTFHRLTCAIEDAGFEIRDCLSWLYGSGFPKSLDVSKAMDKAAGAVREVVGSKVGTPGYSLTGNDTESHSRNAYGIYADSESECAITAPATDLARQWDGWGTALKPAWEPIILARKPLIGTVAANVAAYGTGAININATRIESGPDHAEKCASVVGLQSNRNGNAYGEWTGERTDSYSPLGRWPANVVLDDDSARALDAEVGERKSGGPQSGKHYTDQPRGGKHGIYGAMNNGTVVGYTDTGGPSRFFLVAHDDPTHYECESCKIIRHIDELTAGCPQCGQTMTPYTPPIEAPLGRWPANVILGCCGNDPHDVDCPAAMLDAEVGELTTHGGGKAPRSRDTAIVYGKYGETVRDPRFKQDTGGPSRFYYTAKAPTSERWGVLSCDCQAAERPDRNQRDQTDTTSPPRAISGETLAESSNSLTLSNGSNGTGPSRLDSKSTIETATKPTTRSTTSNCLVPPTTSAFTPDANSETGNGGSHVTSVEHSSPSPESIGISVNEGIRSTAVVGLVTSLRSLPPSACESCGKPRSLTSHPTQKPLSLMRWLVRLITPPNGTVFDPFMGSGSTGCACVLEGFSFIGIEQNESYLTIARKRIEQAQGPMFAAVEVAG